MSFRENQSSSKSRIVQIDAARGTAMLFVFLAHFGSMYLYQSGAPSTLCMLVNNISKVATPTFMMISGIMLGYLYRTKKDSFGMIRSKLQDRGLFMLLIGHLIISIAHIPLTGSLPAALTYVFITDTIGFCIIVGPILIERWSLVYRVSIGISIYILGWVGAFIQYPNSLIWEIVRSIIFGSENWVMDNYLRYTFPLVPWFGVYLASSCLGEKLGEFQIKGELESGIRLLGRMALIFVSTGIFALVIWKFVKLPYLLQFAYFPAWQSNYLFKKLPPGPMYLLLFGGLGLLILYMLFRMPDKPFWRNYLVITSRLGQTSFFAFVIQYYVYFVFFHLAHLNYTIFWPVYLLGSVIFIVSLSYICHSRQYNRFLTLRWKN